MKELKTTKKKLKRRIDKAFFRFNGRIVVPSSEILKELDMSPLVSYMFGGQEKEHDCNYTTNRTLRTTVFMKIRKIKTQAHLIEHLQESPKDAVNLGYVSKGAINSALSGEVFTTFLNEGLTKDTERLIAWFNNKIKQKATEKGIVLDPWVRKGGRVNKEKHNKYSRKHYYKRKRKFLEDKSCARCSISDWRVLVFDHIKAVSKGGSEKWKNIQILCANCHHIKGMEERDWKHTHEKRGKRITHPNLKLPKHSQI